MPTPDEMRAQGFEPEDYATDVVGVWPEHHQAVRFFRRLQTQWRHGMNGPTGLEYASVLALLRTLRLPKEQAGAVFDSVQVMEAAAMQEMHHPNTIDLERYIVR